MHRNLSSDNMREAFGLQLPTGASPPPKDSVTPRAAAAAERSGAPFGLLRQESMTVSKDSICGVTHKRHLSPHRSSRMKAIIQQVDLGFEPKVEVSKKKLLRPFSTTSFEEQADHFRKSAVVYHDHEHASSGEADTPRTRRRFSRQRNTSMESEDNPFFVARREAARALDNARKNYRAASCDPAIGGSTTKVEDHRDRPAAAVPDEASSSFEAFDRAALDLQFQRELLTELKSGAKKPFAGEQGGVSFFREDASRLYRRQFGGIGGGGAGAAAASADTGRLLNRKKIAWTAKEQEIGFSMSRDESKLKNRPMKVMEANPHNRIFGRVEAERKGSRGRPDITHTQDDELPAASASAPRGAGVGSTSGKGNKTSMFGWEFSGGDYDKFTYDNVNVRGNNFVAGKVNTPKSAQSDLWSSGSEGDAKSQPTQQDAKTVTSMLQLRPIAHSKAEPAAATQEASALTLTTPRRYSVEDAVAQVSRSVSAHPYSTSWTTTTSATTTYRGEFGPARGSSASENLQANQALLLRGGGQVFAKAAGGRAGKGERDLEKGLGAGLDVPETTPRTASKSVKLGATPWFSSAARCAVGLPRQLIPLGAANNRSSSAAVSGNRSTDTSATSSSSGEEQQNRLRVFEQALQSLQQKRKAAEARKAELRQIDIGNLQGQDLTGADEDDNKLKLFYLGNHTTPTQREATAARERQSLQISERKKMDSAEKFGLKFGRKPRQSIAGKLNRYAEEKASAELADFAESMPWSPTHVVGNRRASWQQQRTPASLLKTRPELVITRSCSTTPRLFPAPPSADRASGFATSTANKSGNKDALLGADADAASSIISFLPSERAELQRPKNATGNPVRQGPVARSNRVVVLGPSKSVADGALLGVRGPRLPTASAEGSVEVPRTFRFTNRPLDLGTRSPRQRKVPVQLVSVLVQAAANKEGQITRD
eukprot:g948.t1